MTLRIERARTRRPITWLTLIGVLLLPVIIGGVLTAALYNPTERLHQMSAAIVNNDEPVTLDGQLVPLGRQLTAGLVKGSDQMPSNLDWTISNTKDATKGLANGTYQAVVTIPAGFTAAALSPGQELAGKAAGARQATIQVTTAPDARVIDQAITTQLASTAASVMGRSMSQATMERVFLSFTTLGEQLGKAADGATTWAAGARQAASGTTTLAGGIRQLAGGAATLADGADGLSSGLAQLSNGTATWAAGARSAATGLDSWAAGAQQLAGSTTQLAGGLSQIAGGMSQLPQIPQQVIDAANQLAANSEQAKQGVSDAVDRLDAAVTQCRAQGQAPDLCDTLAQVADQARAALPKITSAIDQSGTIAKGMDGLNKLPAGLAQLSDGMNQVAGGMNSLAAGATNAAAGVDRLADGAGNLSSGMSQSANGASQWASGAHAWADGASQSAAGADTLATGVTSLADGADSLANGLKTATKALPSFTDQKAKTLASVVADPVAATSGTSSLFGASAIPLLAMLALWFGSLAAFVALRAVSRKTLTSRRPSALLAARALAPAAAIGAAQGLLVAGVVQLAASYDWGTWSLFAAVCVVAGVAFAAVNQALVALFGGAGRWVAALVGVAAVAANIVSTVPAVLVTVASLLPTAPGLSAGLAALNGTSGIGAGIAGLVIWAVLSFTATTLVVMRRRTTSPGALLKWVPARG